MKKITLWLVILILALFAGTARAKNLEIIKNEEYRIARDQINQASYNILTISFYSNMGTDFGRIPIKIGRGTVVKQSNGQLALVSANHVINSNATYKSEVGMFPVDLILHDTMVFIVPNDVSIYSLHMRINLFTGTINESRSYTNDLIKLEVFEKIADSFDELNRATPLDLDNIYNPSGVDLAKATIDTQYYNGLNYVDFSMYASEPELEMGYEVAIIGCPSGFGTAYREGVVSSPNFFNVRTNTLQDERFVVSIYSNGGDSGSSVLGTDQFEDLKIFGVLTHAQPTAPGLGIVYSAPYVFKILNLE